MPALTINQRLDALLPKLQDARLLSNRGIGNEIGFYIFDYDAEYEPLVHYLTPLRTTTTIGLSLLFPTKNTTYEHRRTLPKRHLS